MTARSKTKTEAALRARAGRLLVRAQRFGARFIAGLEGHGHRGFTMAHLSILPNIEPDGTRASVLAERSGLSEAVGRGSSSRSSRPTTTSAARRTRPTAGRRRAHHRPRRGGVSRRQEGEARDRARLRAPPRAWRVSTLRRALRPHRRISVIAFSAPKILSVTRAVLRLDGSIDPSQGAAVIGEDIAHELCSPVCWSAPWRLALSACSSAPGRGDSEEKISTDHPQSRSPRDHTR